MQTNFECIPCFIRQTLDSVRFVGGDETLQERVLRTVLRHAAEMDLHDTPPAMGAWIHRVIREQLGDDDPYRRIKEQSNRFALGLYPDLKKRVEESDDPLDTALRLAIAGNIIDFGVTTDVRESMIHEGIEHALRAPLPAEALDAFRTSLSTTDDLLYLGDNAGEIVFDRLLIETLSVPNVTFAVRGGPVINDVTVEDTRIAGLPEPIAVIDNGYDAPGTILNACSKAFQERFLEAGMVIAKGQGNYETLSDVPREVFFLLKAKCPVIARHIGCDVGAIVLEKR